MAKMSGLSPAMKFVVGAGIALVVWAILGVGIGLVTLYNSTMILSNVSDPTSSPIPTTVLAVARTLVAVGAGIGVALKYFE